MDFLNNLTNSLSEQFGNLIPGVLGAILVLIIGFFVAKVIKRIAKKLLSKTQIDDNIQKSLNTSIRVDEFVAKLLYYLVVLISLLIALNLLGADSVLVPLQDMIHEFIGYIPNIVAAGIIGYAGYFIAKIGSGATGFISERLEVYANKMGFDAGSVDLSKIVSQFVFIIIFIPIIILALDTLNMEAISQPASQMLTDLLEAIPMILAAGLILGLFFIVGRFITNFIADLLINMGLDKFSESLSLNSILGERSISKLVGNIIFFFIMFTGIIAAAEKLELGQVTDVLNDVFHIAGQIFFGLAILLGGLFISNIAVKTLSMNPSNKWMIPVIRFAILGIFLAFALHTMGIAESIVNLAFGLTLGAIAVAFALAFGLGGREAAGEQLKKFFDNINNK